MSKSADSYGAYAVADRLPQTGSQGIGAVFLKSADALEKLVAGEMPTELAQTTLEKVRDLWTIMQIGLVDPETVGPDQLKANLVSLSIFADGVLLGLDARAGLSEQEIAGLRNLAEIHRHLGVGFTSMPNPEAGA